MNAIHLCGPCNLIFPHRAALDQHCQMAGHPFCHLCSTYSADLLQLLLHFEQFHSSPLDNDYRDRESTFAHAEAFHTLAEESSGSKRLGPETRLALAEAAPPTIQIPVQVRPLTFPCLGAG